MNTSKLLGRALTIGSLLASGVAGTVYLLSDAFHRIFASGALAAVCWAAQTWVLGGWNQWGILLKVGGLLGTIAIAAAAYFLTAMALRIPELDDVTALAKRKFGRLAKR